MTFSFVRDFFLTLKMMKARRYLRGSGRVLAFVFIASVIWLLFDMAALRMSLNDVNNQLLKERALREREPTVTRAAKKGFRHGAKPRDQMLGDDKVKSFEQRRGNVRSDLRKVTSKQDLPAKKAVNLDLSERKLQRDRVMDVVNKGTGSVVVPKTTRGSPGAPLQTSEKKQVNVGDAEQKAAGDPDIETNEPENKARAELSHRAEKSQPVKITSKPPHEDVKEKVNINEDKILERTIDRQDLNAAQQSKDDSTAVRKAGVHKVLSMDVTLTPRDAKAVGQFGQAAVVASNEDSEVKKRWDEGHFNVYLSDQIPVDRAIPDTRPET